MSLYVCVKKCVQVDIHLVFKPNVWGVWCSFRTQKNTALPDFQVWHDLARLLGEPCSLSMNKYCYKHGSIWLHASRTAFMFLCYRVDSGNSCQSVAGLGSQRAGWSAICNNVNACNHSKKTVPNTNLIPIKSDHTSTQKHAKKTVH